MAATGKRTTYKGRKVVPVGPLFAPVEGQVYVEGLGCFPDLERAKATVDAKAEGQAQEAAGQLTIGERPAAEAEGAAHRLWSELHRDHGARLVLVKVGDFWETFEGDAETLSGAVGLTLTGYKVAAGQRVPLCGIPHHALDRYLRLLVEKGIRAVLAHAAV